MGVAVLATNSSKVGLSAFFLISPCISSSLASCIVILSILIFLSSFQPQKKPPLIIKSEANTKNRPRLSEGKASKACLFLTEKVETKRSCYGYLHLYFVNLSKYFHLVNYAHKLLLCLHEANFNFRL